MHSEEKLEVLWLFYHDMSNGYANVKLNTKN